MMLAAALLLMQAPADAGPPDSDFAEIEEMTVIAQRLRSISVNVTRDAQGEYHCDLSQSTGLLKLDGELCQATTKCVGKGKTEQDAVRACVEKAKPDLLTHIRGYMLAERTEAGA